MKDLGFIRSALFVPGNRPDRVDKAVQTEADVVIVDLEDAVPVGLKIETRPIVRDKIRQYGDRRMLVRINGPETEFVRGDLEEIVCEPLTGVIVPKIESADNMQFLHQLLCQAEQAQGIAKGSLAMIPLIETALAVENAMRIASSKLTPRRHIIMALGAADLALDVGFEISKGGQELAYPRARIAMACAAAGLGAPLDTPYMVDLKDHEALEADIIRAKRFGFQGKLCIHPNQVIPCNRIFSPSEEEIAFARKVIQAFETAESDGKAAILVDGKFVDYPVVERSRRVLEMGSAKQV